MPIGKPTVNATYYRANKDNEELQLAQYKDLGITITTELSPSIHIEQISQKAQQRANSILRCFVSGDIKMLVCAFVVYVRPMLEYNSVIWSPHS